MFAPFAAAVAVVAVLLFVGVGGRGASVPVSSAVRRTGLPADFSLARSAAVTAAVREPRVLFDLAGLKRPQAEAASRLGVTTPSGDARYRSAAGGSSFSQSERFVAPEAPLNGALKKNRRLRASGNRVRGVEFDAQLTLAQELVSLDDDNVVALVSSAVGASPAARVTAATVTSLTCEPLPSGIVTLDVVAQVAGRVLSAETAVMEARRAVVETLGAEKLLSGGGHWACGGSPGAGARENGGPHMLRRVRRVVSLDAWDVTTLQCDGSRACGIGDRGSSRLPSRSVGVRVVLETGPASLIQAFKDAKVVMKTGVFDGRRRAPPRGSLPRHARLHEEGGEDEAEVVGDTAIVSPAVSPDRAPMRGDGGHLRRAGGTRMVGSIWGWFSGVWHRAQHIAEEAEHAAEAAWDAAKALATGHLSVPGSPFILKAMSFNFDPSTGEAEKLIVAYRNTTTSMSIDCQNCYMSFDVDFVFELDISNYELISMTQMIEGDAYAGSAGNISAALEESVVFSRHLGTVQVPPIEFYLGSVPVYINVTVPIELHVDVDVTARGSAVADASADFSLQMGMKYDQEHGFQYVDSHSFQHRGTLTGLSGGVEAKATLSIIPTANLIIDYIGGPYVRIDPFLEFTVRRNTTDCASEVYGTLAFGLQLAVGAEIDIEAGSTVIFKHMTNATTVASTKRPLKSGCIEFAPRPSSAVRTAPVARPTLALQVPSFTPSPYASIGDTYFGLYNPDVQPECQCPRPGGESATCPSGTVAFQKTGPDTWVGSFNVVSGVPKPNNTCIMQAGFIQRPVNNPYSQFTMQFVPVKNADGEPLLLEQCQYGRSIEVQSVAAIFASTTQNGPEDVLVLDNYYPCNLVKLFRQST